jgi:hypothetical protein
MKQTKVYKTSEKHLLAVLNHDYFLEIFKTFGNYNPLLGHHLDVAIKKVSTKKNNECARKSRKALDRWSLSYLNPLLTKYN